MLTDRFGREFPYLRLSVTDVCNFSCSYCLPDGYQCHDHQPFLSIAEITRLVRAFAALGVWKIRLTGGEPTTRKDFCEIVQAIAGIDGIKRIAMTTNGWSIKRDLERWQHAGVTSLNISVDSLDARMFAAITGHNKLQELLEGVDEALTLPFERVKINSVLLRDLNHHELDAFLAWIKSRPLTLRFIELMQTGDNADYFAAHHLRSQWLIDQLTARGWYEIDRLPGAGPAREFVHDNSVGRIGLIAPYSKDFCTTCNRLRVTALGALRLCLFGDAGSDLRDLLQSDAQQPLLQQRIADQLQLKVASHFLHEGNSGATRHLAMVGG